MTRTDVIQHFIDTLNAETYLEIGIRHGGAFFSVQCKNKIGVDVEIPFEVKDHPETYFEMASDEYFKTEATHFDVAFIDGDHTFAQSLRDAWNCLRCMNPNGVILLHDCNPAKEELATPEFGSSPDWCGEVWKTILTLRKKSDLRVSVLDEDYGIGIVRRGTQEPLVYSRKQVKEMTYKDLEANRSLFLNLTKALDVT